MHRRTSKCADCPLIQCGVALRREGARHRPPSRERACGRQGNERPCARLGMGACAMGVRIRHAAGARLQGRTEKFAEAPAPASTTTFLKPAFLSAATPAGVRATRHSLA